MSLCPNYCDCPPCKHGTSVCEFCGECKREYDRKKQQERHEDSVRRQKMKMRRLHE